MSSMSEILFVVTHPGASPYLLGLSQAAIRHGNRFSVFFTGDGVLTLLDHDTDLLSVTGAAFEAIACEHAWNSRGIEAKCPVNMGSQTDHSRMIGVHDKVVSL